MTKENDLNKAQYDGQITALSGGSEKECPSASPEIQKSWRKGFQIGQGIRKSQNCKEK